jgi:hypothetical protein
MKKHVKKLQLSRETLIHLSAEQSKMAAGGDSLFCPPKPTSDSVNACCSAA